MLLKSGDVVLYRGTAILSRVIQYMTCGPWSHAGMLWSDEVRRDGPALIDVVEGVGGRSVSFDAEVKRTTGEWDVFRIDRERWPEFKPKYAVAAMLDFRGRPYGWRGVLRFGVRRLAVIRAFCGDISIDDRHETGAPPFCSHAVAVSMRKHGRVDLCPRKPDHLVSPSDLGFSAALTFVGTIRP